MRPTAFSASGNSFGVHEWRGSGPATLHVHHSDDEAWHVLDGELTFRYSDRVESVAKCGAQMNYLRFILYVVYVTCNLTYKSSKILASSTEMKRTAEDDAFAVDFGRKLNLKYAVAKRASVSDQVF